MFHLISKELQQQIDRKYMKTYKGFFKTQKGQYGEKDIFLGIRVPDLRKVVQKHFQKITFEEIEKFLYSPYHEFRLFALLVLVKQYQHKSASLQTKSSIYNFYMSHITQVNSWDLVDVTVPHIIGHYLFDKKKSILYEFANSNDLWLKRIAIVSTFYFIKQKSYTDTLKIAQILLNDSHDLIHKAVGWAIRNVGNEDKGVMLDFLNKHYTEMPRTTLRYAIEKLDEPLRQQYLKGLV